MTKQKVVKNNVNKQDRFKQKIANIAKYQDLGYCRSLVKEYCKELNISEQDFAASLLMLQQPELHQQMQFAIQLQQAKSMLESKMVRYRLEVGRADQISVNELKALLVAETGLEPDAIGKIDVQQMHTVINLPDGMPPEIFQLLKEVELNSKPLKIKRLAKEKNGLRNKKFQRNRRKKYAAKNNQNKLKKSVEELTAKAISIGEN